MQKWEYKDLVIPINLKWSGNEANRQFLDGFDRLVLQQLTHEGQEGWQAVEPTDYHSLIGAKRVEEKWFFLSAVTVRSATIRLKRMVQD